ncbi:FtsQ-type POTRA domain-containing protein [Sphingobacterium sp. SRCM116780]|uniref:cell division protein FtsQ/DivIB n=1 Tax=Sphingobacterium sp. SRCM116780 TaxID=2907623 RepID=UPI001F21E35C|nr:FtsQ-type POTRA domain-containing protein [Sphingobacterium sp. SRCM116780]UIR56478.1 FtsQ-type POTRA domain-containing protein [Sphingobacterium sp. SRCM116780]
MLKYLHNIKWNRVLYLSLFFLGVIAVVIVMSLVNRKDDQQVCREVNIFIEGKEAFIDQDDISKLIRKNYGDIVGKSLIGIPLQKIEETLRKLPYVSKATVHLDMDGALAINIEQREVVMRVINKNGREYYIDLHGLKVPTTLKYVPHVMIATGNIEEGYKNPLDSVKSSLVKDLFRVTQFIEKDELWSNQVVQVFVNNDNDIELVPRVGNQQLIIGTADSLDQKFSLLQTFYKEIMPKVGVDTYNKVNVKYAGQIICEKRGVWTFDDLYNPEKKIKNNTL